MFADPSKNLATKDVRKLGRFVEIGKFQLWRNIMKHYLSSGAPVMKSIFGDGTDATVRSRETFKHCGQTVSREGGEPMKLFMGRTFYTKLDSLNKPVTATFFKEPLPIEDEKMWRVVAFLRQYAPTLAHSRPEGINLTTVHLDRGLHKDVYPKLKAVDHLEAWMRAKDLQPAAQDIFMRKKTIV